MTPEPDRLRDLFLAALQVPADRRPAYVREAAAGDDDLRARVESLVAAHVELGSVARPAEPDPGRTLDFVGEPARPGDVLAGRYKLLEEIGEGGMGTVWMAEQTDPVQRRVAVKLIRPGMDSRQVVARFEAERQALALMDHPNIAKVHDAGLTPAGRPFFVMELVKGTPITRFCDDKRLPVRDRLALFADVCRAVQHAHQKGVIHRDLKPSNVLVAPYDGRPVVKVIDFGVAKATGQKLTEATLFTGFGAVVGTPEYMSPEQAEVNNQDVDTRSDVYALGVLLYELLTGSTPLTRRRVQEAALLEVLRVIREEDPPRPSTRLSSTEELPSISARRHTEPAKLTRLVRGELDWIVMRALEKDRSRRYETANGFAADVQRYLADEPVLACPPSAGYRLRKFARRNKSGLAAAALVLFFLVLLGGGAGWAVRDRAARQAKAGVQVDLIFAEMDQLEKEQKWPEALAAVRRAEAVVAGGDVDAPAAERVRDRLRGLEFIDGLERVRMAETWVEGRLNSAGADRMYAQTFREHGVDVDELPVEAAIDRLKSHPALAAPLAAALDAWAQTRWNAQGGLGDDTAAKRLIAIARGIDPDPLRDRVRATWRRPEAEVGDDLRRIAESIDVRAEHPSTLVILHQKLLRVKHPDHAVRLMRDAQRLHPEDFWVNFYLALLLSQQKDYEGAVRFYTAAVSIRPQATGALVNLGIVLRAQKKLDEAIAVYRRALEVDPNLVAALNNLGVALADQKKLDEAVVCYHRVLVLDRGHAGAHSNLGTALSYLGKHQEAVAAFRKAIALDPELSNAHYNLGQKLFAQGKLDEGIAAFRRVIVLEPGNPEAHNYLGFGLVQQKKPGEAISSFREAIKLDPNHARAHFNLGRVLADKGEVGEAIAWLQKSIQLDPTNAAAHYALGHALLKQHKPDEAIAAFRQAVGLEPSLGPPHIDLGNPRIDQKRKDEAILAFAQAMELVELGNALRDGKKPDEAAAAYRKAIDLDPKYALAHSGLGIALGDQGKPDAAIAAYRKAIELDPKLAVAHSNLGTALLAQKKPDEAVGAFRKAIELDPNNAHTRTNLGAALMAQKKPEEAVVAYRKAIELDPKYAVAHNNLGTALTQLKKPDAAIAAYRKAIELDPNLANAHSNLGLTLRVQRKPDEALQTYREAVRLIPGNASLRDHLTRASNGRAWELAMHPEPQKRDPGRAVRLATEAVEAAPEDPNCWNTLGAAHYRAGRWKEAVAALQKYRELRKDDAIHWANPFLLAMAHWQLGEKQEARKWFDQGVEWMERKKWKGAPLAQLRAEAAELLGID